MVETAEAKQVCWASTLLYPDLEFEVKPCGEYTREDFRAETAVDAHTMQRKRKPTGR